MDQAMTPPSFYDPNSDNEKPVPLSCAPLVSLTEHLVLQPPLSRHGVGPGLIVFLPPDTVAHGTVLGGRCLDPEPVQKWAEEGFAVVGVTGASSVSEALLKGIATLHGMEQVDIKDKYAIAVYDPAILVEVIAVAAGDVRIVCIVSYGAQPESSPIPTLSHVPESSESLSTTSGVSRRYPCSSPQFVLPGSDGYHPASAAMAHSRSLVFLRNNLGGPIFDLEAIWEEHAYFEFELRSVAKTMGTMVAEPYVNHVPTMTGGIGRESLTAFYRDHFIFANPADASMESVSRTVGPDRVVDEFVFKCTHDRVIDWLLPGVPPSNRKIVLPMLGVINIRGDRLYHEHIWWDQASALLQVGAIPTHVPYPGPAGKQMLRLPVAGAESARLLVDETDGRSNEMFGKHWGISGTI